jgi:hypothetical protein
MVEKTGEGDRFNWRLPLYAALGALIIFVPVAIWTSEAFFYVLVVAPIISLLLGVFLLVTAIAKRPHRCLSILSMLAIYWVVSAALLVNYSAIRSAGRWFLWSHRYKINVLAQQASANGELKHIEWDGWGWAGQDTTVFLVFDPTDSLSAAAMSHQPGKFNGIPCEVPPVRRLESHWYTVRFYTDEYWGRCH